MAISIISEKYDNNIGFLKSNVGDWMDGCIEFSHTVEHTYNSQNPMYYRDSTASGGGVWELEWTSGDWAAEGFSAGDDIEINIALTRSCDNSAISNTTVIWSGTIAYIQNDPKKIVLTAPLVSNDGTYPVINPTQTFLDTVLPGADSISPSPCGTGSGVLRYQVQDGVVLKVNRPEQIEFLFNLTNNGSTSQSSVIDGQVNRFSYELPALTDFTGYGMAQLGNASGGYFKFVNIQQTEDLGATTKWLLKFRFFQWGIIEDGFAEPDYYDSQDCLAPIGEIRVFPKLSNPVGALISTTSGNTGNTGGFNESYNGEVNPYNVISTIWKDASGNVISAMDYSGTSSFKSIIDFGSTSQTPNSRYRIGILWRPEDSDEYSSRISNLGQNLIVNSPETLIAPDGVVVPLTYFGETDPISGARWDLSNLKFEIVGTNLEVSGDVIANGGSNTLFSAIPDGGRKTTLWVSIGDTPLLIGGVPAMPTSGRVSLKLFDADNIDAPVIGVQIPNVVSETLLDHNGNLITDNSVDNTTTEDDVLYKSEFRLPENIVYSGMRFTISAFNSVTQDEFILENRYISFSNVVSQNGIMQINELSQRNFNLPPSTDRNKIEILRKPSLDISGLAGYELSYGFLNDWRYWLSQGNVNSFFYDQTEPNNGKNKNWQKFYTGDWTLRLSYHTDLNGIEDFNNYLFKIRPYEDDVDVSANASFVVLSDGSTPTELVDDEVIEVTVVFSWNQNFTDEWVEFTVEDYESGNRWVISSVLDQGNITANPLKPIVGNTKIDVSGSGTNTLTCKSLIDTNLIDVNKVSMTYRVYSSPNESGGITEDTKLKEDGTVKEKEDGIIKLLE